MKLYQFYEDCGRMGDLEGLFACTEEDYQKALGKTAWLDEPLGKHSEFDVTVTESNTKVLDISEETVKVLIDAIGDTCISGFDIVQIALEQNEE